MEGNLGRLAGLNVEEASCVVRSCRDDFGPILAPLDIQNWSFVLVFGFPGIWAPCSNLKDPDPVSSNVTSALAPGTRSPRP